MTTKELIDRVAQHTSMTKTRTTELLDMTIAVLQKELLTGNTVLLPDFGTIEMKRKNARVIVHPRTGERTAVPEKMQLTFKAHRTIKDKLKDA